MRYYGKEEGLNPTSTGIIDNQERWYKYSLTFSDFSVGNADTIAVPSGSICTGVKVIPTTAWNAGVSLTVSHNSNTVLTSYDLDVTPGSEEFKLAMVHEALSTGTIDLALDASANVGELDLWLMLSQANN